MSLTDIEPLRTRAAMATTAEASPIVQANLTLWNDIIAGYGPRDFAVRFWDGTVVPPDAGQPERFTLVLEHAGALRQMFWPFNKVGLGEAYIYGDFDIEGDLFAFMSLLRFLIAKKFSLGQRLSLLKKLIGLPKDGKPRVGLQAAKLSGRAQSAGRARQAIAYHYDLSNEFFALWLDSRLVYSCAYFKTEADDIETAEEQKLDHICKKLRLKPGERLLDIGCGWGGLAQFAAECYGANVYGVTLSKKQQEWAEAFIRRTGVQDRCKVDYRDYRDIHEPNGFDKIVCVGILEHLGAVQLPEYFRRIYGLLKPGGVFLNHHITRSKITPVPVWRDFVRRYVFPDGELEPICDVLVESEKAGFELRDVESFREHYALTLRQWVKRLEAVHDEAVKLTDEVCYRVMRIYMVGACFGFDMGGYGLYQSVLSKPDNGRSSLPLTRSDWYE
jgi:cyclopropane-fatty-acyl-phospholipid synthase